MDKGKNSIDRRYFKCFQDRLWTTEYEHNYIINNLDYDDYDFFTYLF